MFLGCDENMTTQWLESTLEDVLENRARKPSNRFFLLKMDTRRGTCVCKPVTFSTTPEDRTVSVIVATADGVELN